MDKKSTPTIDDQITQKREEFTQAQITQSTAYSEYMKAMKGKLIVDEGETEKIEKLDKLMFEHFTSYQHALEDAQKILLELSDLEAQKYLEDFYVNTGENNSIEVIEANGGLIVPVTLYNEENPRLSLLDLALEKIYGWKIGHVDESLKTMGRMFEISRASVYDFLVQDICDKFDC